MFSKSHKVLCLFLQNLEKAGSKTVYTAMGHTGLEKFLSITKSQAIGVVKTILSG